MNLVTEPTRDKWKALMKRGTPPMQTLEPLVREVFQSVREMGDEALLRYTRQFDGAQLESIQLSSQEWEQAEKEVSEELKTAIQQAQENISAFHAAQMPQPVEVETMPGVRCWQEYQPIEKVGIYIPGGTAPLFSTILMLALPARIAGCKEIIMVTPPGRDGSIDPVMLYTARLCGVTAIYKLGGIQAIGALTFGTPSVPAVSKIFGPGNQYVTAAKNFATQFGVAIDMPAGPSEVMVVADDSADPEFVAADLLSQAEHGPDSQVILLTPSPEFVNLVKANLGLQLKKLPRASVAKDALENSRVICLQNKEDLVDFMNEYAPEHLIINTADNSYYTERVRNAGSVFIGPYTPESAGDYASGTNHTLPTNGYAKQYSGVTLQAFMKSITFQEISANGLKALGETIETMASSERLEGHKNAVSVRLNALKQEEG